MRLPRALPLAIGLLAIGIVSGCAPISEQGIAALDSHSAPILLQEQGSFFTGGTVITATGTFDPIAQGAFNPMGQDPAGQTLHGDHAYVAYQVPVNARTLPLVMWHGYGQGAKTWEMTPDGRDGFQTIFLRRGYPVYLLEQPRRGDAGRSTIDETIPALPDEQLWFGIFRFGVWPDFYEGVQFSQDPAALDQFFRQGVPSPNSFDSEVNVAAVSALFDRIGPGVLFTHSASGSQGWSTAIANPNVKAIVSYEPGGDFPFPEGEEVMPGSGMTGTLPLADFEKLTQIPIVIYYGDNIPDEPSTNPGQEQWRTFLAIARRWADVVNAHGGDVTVVHLPEVGVFGNTHFPMADLNNLEIADLTSQFLAEKGLDTRQGE